MGWFRYGNFLVIAWSFRFLSVKEKNFLGRFTAEDIEGFVTWQNSPVTKFDSLCNNSETVPLLVGRRFLSSPVIVCESILSWTRPWKPISLSDPMSTNQNISPDCLGGWGLDESLNKILHIPRRDGGNFSRVGEHAESIWLLSSCSGRGNFVALAIF